MTNLTAALLVLLATNWVEIGTFTDTNRNSFKVEQGRLATNTVAILEFEHHEHRFILKSVEGPIVGERKTPNQVAVWTNNFMLATNLCVTNFLYLTNTHGWWTNAEPL